MGGFCLLVELQRWRVCVCSLCRRLFYTKLHFRGTNRALIKTARHKIMKMMVVFLPCSCGHPVARSVTYLTNKQEQTCMHLNESMTFLRLSCYIFMTFSWLTHDFLMTFSWFFHDFLSIFPNFSMLFSWFSHDFLWLLEPCKY